jgi:pentatricopeptide repeat protein
VKNDLPERALETFEKASFSPNEFLYAISYSACAALLNTTAETAGKKYLKQMPQSFQTNHVVASSALHMFMKFGDVEEAERIFSRMKSPDMSINGVMMNGYNLNDQPHKCLQLFHRIKDQNITPHEVIPLSAVCACSHIGLVSVSRPVIDHLPVHSLKSRYLQNALIDMWVSGSH